MGLLSTLGSVAVSYPIRQVVPQVPVWGIADFVQRLKATLLELESAWESGHLRERLADPGLIEQVGSTVLGVYQNLVGVAPSHLPFRRRGVDGITERISQLLQEPTRIFEARRDPRCADTSGRPSRLMLRVEPEGYCMSAAQAIAVRFWGVGFQSDEETEQRLTRILVWRVLQRLASDLAGLQKVERWLARSALIEAEVHVVPDQAGRAFEQLMIDVLNEKAPIARQATLYEDFVEKTDIRVHVPDLGRRRGARVQVTQVIQPSFHAKKLESIQHLDEFVILSPLAVARAMASTRADQLLDSTETRALWDALPANYANVFEFAKTLKTSLTAALKRPIQGPRGPSAHVPPALRRLLRHYVVVEAHRSTRALRQRVEV